MFLGINLSLVGRLKSSVLPLLDRFTGAAAAYSLRSLSKDTTNVVRVRRSADNAELDFTPDEINDGSLTSWVNGQDTAPADYGDGAAAAYSLRYVSDSYTGAVVRVRRSSDNAELDFTPDEIDDGSLLTWVGAGGTDNGFVTTWYDQSGNSNDATQATAANQPKIVDGGVLVTEGGKAAIDFDGANFQHLSNSYTNAGTDDFISFSVFRVNSSAPFRFPSIYGESADVFGLRINMNNNQYRFEIENSAAISAINSVVFDEATLGTCLFSNPNGTLFVNAEELVSANDFTNTLDVNGFNLGWTGFSREDQYLYGTISEAIFYFNDQSANRGAIEANINAYYSIFEGNNGFVTTWYDQSGNGNDATQVTAASQPKIVDGGVLVTENGKAALRFDSVWQELRNRDLEFDYPFSSFFVFKPSADEAGNYTADYSTAVTNGLNVRGIKGDYRWLGENAGSAIYEQGVATLTVNSTASSYINGTVVHDSITPLGTSVNILVIGNRADGDIDLNGTISELILYPSDQSANRTDIEQNIADYYGITLS